MEHNKRSTDLRFFRKGFTLNQNFCQLRLAEEF